MLFAYSLIYLSHSNCFFFFFINSTTRVRYVSNFFFIQYTHLIIYVNNRWCSSVLEFQLLFCSRSEKWISVRSEQVSMTSISFRDFSSFKGLLIFEVKPHDHNYHYFSDLINNKNLNLLLSYKHFTIYIKLISLFFFLCTNVQQPHLYRNSISVVCWKILLVSFKSFS